MEVPIIGQSLVHWVDKLLDNLLRANSVEEPPLG